MTKDQFWRLVSDSRSSFFETEHSPNERGMIEGVMDHQVARLQEALEAFSPDQIVDFSRIFDDLMDRAYSWELWAAAHIMCQGCSDDGFSDFRAWLISMGEGIYNSALHNPDSLVELIDRKDVEYFLLEEMAYVANKAHKKVTGTPIIIPSRKMEGRPADPTGTRWKKDDLQKRLPKLFAKCNQ